MGVTTTMYSIPPQTMEKFRADPHTLDFVLGVTEENPNPGETIEKYEFGRRLEDLIGIFKACGYRTAHEKLDCEGYFYSEGGNYINHENFDVWIVLPSEVKTMVDELQGATFEDLKAKGLAEKVTNYDAKIITEDLYFDYAGDLEEIKAFFKKAADQGHYLIGASG